MKIIVFLLGVIISLSSRAQTGLPPVYELTKDTTYYPIDSAHFQLLEDRTCNLTIDQVSQPPVSGKFYYDAYHNENRSSAVYWLRMRIRNALTKPVQLFYNDFESGYADLYIQTGNTRWLHEQAGYLRPLSQLTNHNGIRERGRLFVAIQPGQTIVVYQRSEMAFWQHRQTSITPALQTQAARIQTAFESYQTGGWKRYFFDGIQVGALLLAALCNVLIFFAIRDRTYLYFGICLFFFVLDRNSYNIQLALFPEYAYTFKLVGNLFFMVFFVFFVESIRTFLRPATSLRRLNRWVTLTLWIAVCLNVAQLVPSDVSLIPARGLNFVVELMIRVVFLLLLVLNLRLIRLQPQGWPSFIATLPLFCFWLISFVNIVTYTLSGQDLFVMDPDVFDYIEGGCFAWMIIFFSGALVGRYNQFSQQVNQQALEREQLERERVLERNRLIANQNEQLERQVQARTAELQTSLDTLKATQAQLIQSEKMASLGELTAGIAHEIQNPLNFVNNFAEVSVELADELAEEQHKPERDAGLETDLLADLKQNLQRISQHGNRASGIVRGMLEHARTATGQKEPTDLNALCDEYLRLAYHGLRRSGTPAKNGAPAEFTCTLITEFDAALGPVAVIAQDMSRVVLNLLTNAFYAVRERQHRSPAAYQPTVTVRTRRLANAVAITVQDNGTGIPASVKQKIFQPFFTTKPTGSGTGLGLSLSYDIVTRGHGGTLTVESREGEGTTFTLTLPAV